MFFKYKRYDNTSNESWKYLENDLWLLFLYEDIWDHSKLTHADCIF